ncbi:hypothetical protein DERP_004265 [Dermatophagoides pteronyssinus]|uniref:Uncharacterized protein n=1 Tax=Dermatophagoides pteronyssinus TaxID=6956 RepID=A0ABQ8J8N5_DERPT|nr:hypothetical protein DERP_004265 [Dermatophagoides pteronyssinus]
MSLSLSVVGVVDVDVDLFSSEEFFNIIAATVSTNVNDPRLILFLKYTSYNNRLRYSTKLSTTYKTWPSNDFERHLSAFINLSCKY